MARIAVVIPSYKVTAHILDVLSKIGSEVERIYVVDDKCPEQSGSFVEKRSSDSRVHVVRNAQNRGVGGATIAGYRAALRDGMDIVVKIDGDGQMDPTLVPVFVRPLVAQEADYTKGNRFFDLTDTRGMPPLRVFGNAGLSFLTKLASGYWDVFDPSNGYTAINRAALERLPLDKLAERYFFESDMLFRLGSIRAVVADVPMQAVYGSEISGLDVKKIFFPFLSASLRNLGKRLFYNYYLRDLSIASIELPVGLVLFGFGALFGAYKFVSSNLTGELTSAGTVMIAALPLLAGLNLILSFLGHDSRAVPSIPLAKRVLGQKLSGAKSGAE